MSTEERIEVPPSGSTGGSGGFLGLLARLLKPLAGMQVSRVRNARGSEQPRMMGFPVLVLTTVGARTGQERSHVVGGFPEAGGWLVIASNAGARNHPAWFLNLAKNPDQVWVELGGRKVKVRPESLRGQARDEAYARISAIAPNYGAYPSKTDREIPVIRLTPEA